MDEIKLGDTVWFRYAERRWVCKRCPTCQAEYDGYRKTVRSIRKGKMVEKVRHEHIDGSVYTTLAVEIRTKGGFTYHKLDSGRVFATREEAKASPKED